MATAPAAPVPAGVLDTAAPVVSVSQARALHVPLPERVLASSSAREAESAASDAAGEPYYWESSTPPASVPVTTLVSHNLHWLGVSVLSGVEYVGEVFSEFFGLFNSRYEWALEAQRAQAAEAEERERREEQRSRWLMIQRMNAAATGQAGRTPVAASTGGEAVPGAGAAAPARVDEAVGGGGDAIAASVSEAADSRDAGAAAAVPETA